MNGLPSSRTDIVLGLEKASLFVRYLGFAFMLLFILYDLLPWNATDLAIVAITIALHNIFTHWVLVTRRYDFFQHPANFVIYLVEVSIIVLFSGADESDWWILYFFVLTGFSVYAPRFRRVVGAGLLFAAAYVAVLLIEYAMIGIRHPVGELGARVVVIILAGWLLGRLSELLRQAEEEARSRAHVLASSEATQRAIFNSAANPIVVYRDNDTVVDANDKACEFLGLPRSEIIGQRTRRFVFDDGTLATKAANLRARGEYRGEQIIVNAEGEERTVESTIRSFIRDGERYFVALIHDVTEQKELDEKNRLATERLERLNREMRTIDDLKTNMLSTLAQKLRAPLAPLLGYLNDLANGELGELNSEQHNAVHVCRRNAQHMLRVVDESLDFQHTETPASTSPKDD